MVKSVGYTLVWHVRSNVVRRVGGYISTHRLRCALIACGVLALALVAGYVWWSVTTWQSLAPSAGEVRRSVRTSVEQLKQKQHDVSDIADVARTAKVDIGALCDVPSLIGWQARVVSAADELLQRCAAQKGEIREVQDALVGVHARAVSEQKFAQRMAATQDTLDTIDATDHAARLAQWKELHAALRDMEPHATLDKAHEAAVAATDSIVASYELLVQADEAQDRAAFDEARAELEKSYSQLDTIQNYSTDSFDTLLDALDRALRAL